MSTAYLVWGVAISGPHYYEGFYSALDAAPQMTFVRFERGMALEKPEQIGMRVDLERGLPWLWRRLGGEPLPSPKSFSNRCQRRLSFSTP